jgi:hypothetical protein
MDGGALLGLLVFMGGLTGIVSIIVRGALRLQDQKLRARSEGLGPSVQAELDDLRAQLAEQQDLRQRLSELEERVDFAERVLASQRERVQLPKVE